MIWSNSFCTTVQNIVTKTIIVLHETKQQITQTKIVQYRNVNDKKTCAVLSSSVLLTDCSVSWISPQSATQPSRTHKNINSQQMVVNSKYSALQQLSVVASLDNLEQHLIFVKHQRMRGLDHHKCTSRQRFHRAVSFVKQEIWANAHEMRDSL